MSSSAAELPVMRAARPGPRDQAPHAARPGPRDKTPHAARPGPRDRAPQSFEAFLQRTLDAIEEQLPWAHAELNARCASRCIQLQVGDELLQLDGRGGAVRLTSGPARDADARLKTSHALLVSLLAGRHGLLEAVRSGQLELQGSAAQLAAFHGALMAFFEGAVRVAQSDQWLTEYRAWVSLHHQGGERR